MDDERYQLFYEKITTLQPEDAGSIDEVEFLMFELKGLIAVIQDYKHDLDATTSQKERAEKLEELIVENLKSLIIQTDVLCLLAEIEEQLASN